MIHSGQRTIVYREALVRVRRYADSMQHLADSLLLLARLDAGSGRIERSAFDLGELAFETINALPEEGAKRVVLDMAENAEPVRVVAEPRLIGILLRNLIENALRYSPPSSPVTVRIKPGEGSVIIEVEDKGPGIGESHAARIFDRFYRIDPARSREAGGFGLGLAIAKAIADVHRASLALQSAPGGGTLVSVSL